LGCTALGGRLRRIAVHMQSTFNGRIASADGGFWEPFAWGQEEMASWHRLTTGP